MSVPFIRLPVSAAGVAKISISDVEDYFTNSIEVGARAFWDLSEGKHSFSSLVNSTDIMIPMDPSVVSWSDVALNTTTNQNKGIKTNILGSEFSDGHTVVAVFKCDSLTNAQLVGDLSADFKGVAVTVASNGAILSYLGKGSTGDVAMNPSHTIAANQWVFIAQSISNDAGNKAVRKLATASATRSIGVTSATDATYAYVPSSQGIAIGSTGRASSPMGVSFAELFIMPSAKSDAELITIYNNTKERMKLKDIAI